MTVRVLVAVEQALIRAGVEALLKGSEFEVVGQATSFAETIDLAKALQPQIMLLDVRMRQEDGLITLEQIRSSQPEIGVIMLANADTPAFVARANLLGAKDYLLKDVSKEDFLEALRRVADDEELPQSSLMCRIQAMMSRRKFRYNSAEVLLSKREQQVLRHIALGLTNREIADALGISVFTVKEYVDNVLRKTSCRDRTAAAVWGFSRGLVELSHNAG